MYIISTDFAPKNNNFSQGGLAFKVGMTRVGYVRKAKRQGRAKVYNARDPTRFTYSGDIMTRVDDNIFVPLEITGSTTDKKGKKLLLDLWKREHIGELEQLQQRVTTMTGKTAIIRYQWDNAGPHTEAALKTYLEMEFLARG